MALIAWIEATPVAHWVRESVWGFPISLIVHAWSMALLVGISLLLALSVLGVTPRLLPGLLDKGKAFIWSAFAVSLGSGLFLLSAYPERPLSNPDFYLKLVLVAVAMTLALKIITRCRQLQQLHETAVPGVLRWYAKGLLFAWFGTIAAGRLLYYTYATLTAG